MARTWTVSDARAGDQFKASQFNDEANASAQQINGNLDQNNMPMNSVTAAKFADPVIEDNVYGDWTTSTYMPTQSYHVSTHVVDNETVEPSVLGPNTIYLSDWTVDEWRPFWNSMDLGGDETLIFRAKEGMLYGGLTMSLERRTAYNIIMDNGVPSYFTQGEDVTSEIGIFVNGVLVARTGEMFAGAYTIDLPFSSPIGTELVTIEVKWTSAQGLTPSLPGITTGATNIDVHKYFACAGLQLWARNQYR